MYDNGPLQALGALTFIIKPTSHTVVEAPEGVRIICRENAEELSEALRQRQISVHENYQNFSLLDLVIGWPKGLKTLLEFGVDANQFFTSLTYLGTDYNNDSAKILLKNG